MTATLGHESVSAKTRGADALSYAHSRGVIHRDIKPENILLESGHAVVADFGIARAITAAGGEQLTATGMAIGTPTYMSPEQAAGGAELDGRSDLYSLSCVLYEMLAGQPPFTGPTLQSIVHQHLMVEPPNITSIRPAVPASVAAALQRALAKAPADRFNLVALFAEALARREPAPVPSAAPRFLRLALVGVAALVLVAGALLALRRARVAPGARRTAIAVLPFENLSAERQHGYFAPGLHDELLTQLAKVAALSVRPRTSVMSYAGTTKPMKTIAEELAVGTIVEGSVQVVGNRLRVNVQLIDPATETHLWAEHYDRTLDDAFAVQSEIAQRIVQAVGATLTTAEAGAIAAAPTANAEAYRLYLEGREHFLRPGYLHPNIEGAQVLFERALGLDPTFALAHAALSEVHGQIYWEGYDPSPTRAAAQRQEAEAALRLAPALPQAHLAMGLAHYWGHRDYRRALDEFAIALQGLPNDAHIWKYVSAVRRRAGQWDEAFAAFEKAAQIDPRDANAVFDGGGLTLMLMHRYAEAARMFDRALRIAPNFHSAEIGKGWTYMLWRGELDTLRMVLRRIPADADFGGTFGSRAAAELQLFRWGRQPDSLLHVLATVRDRVFETQVDFVPSTLYAAWAHQLRGDRPAARAAFDSARVFLDSVVKERPDAWPVHAARGLALAGLDRRADALLEARWLQRSTRYRDDAIDGTAVAENRAQILAQVGDAGDALGDIERVLSKPSVVSVHKLRLDPLFDPIRNDSRFQALLKKYGG